MNRYQIEITDPASRDLYEIGNYITKELSGPEAALRVVNGIADAIFSLEEMPYRNPLVRDETLRYMAYVKSLLVIILYST